MNSVSHFNLFRKRMSRFNERTSDLPISLWNPLFVALGPEVLKTASYMDYGASPDALLDAVVVDIRNRSGNDSSLDVMFMHYFILSSDLYIDIMISHIKEYVNAASITNQNPEQRDCPAFWLNNWHPERVLNETEFYKGLIKSRTIWQEETDNLRKALLHIAHPQFYFPEEYYAWQVLDDK